LLRPSVICLLLRTSLVRVQILRGRPATRAPEGRDAVRRVSGPTSTAGMCPTWRASTATRSPGGTYLSGNERREAHHVPTWMRSYPRDPTDPPISPPPRSRQLELRRTHSRKIFFLSSVDPAFLLFLVQRSVGVV
jgi:hypothetical protein